MGEEAAVNRDLLADKIISIVRANEQFTDDEAKVLRSVVLFIISMRTACVVMRALMKAALWGGWVVLLFVAWKNGNLPSTLTNWPHP